MAGTYAKYTATGISGGGGGGGGITSINGDTTASQIIAAGTGISVSSSGGTTTISNTETPGANTFLSNLTAPTAVNVPLILPSGTTAAPSLTFTGDTNTGLANQASTAVDIINAGTISLRVEPGDVQMNMASTTGNFTFLRSVNTGEATFQGGTGSASGLIEVYGASHATKPSRVELANTAGIGLSMDNTGLISMPLNAQVPTIFGDSVAGDYTTFTTTPGHGNLNLNSTSNATKGYVQVADSSGFLFGDANALAAGIAGSIAGPGAPPAAFYMAFDAAGPLFQTFDNLMSLDVYGGAVFFNFGATSGTLASPTYFPSGHSAGGLTWTTWNGTSPEDQGIAAIDIQATETQSATGFGTELRFSTTPNGGTTPSRSMLVSGNSITLGPAGATGQHVLNTSTATPAAGVGTISNLPAGFSGNPTGYIQITINGSTHVIPFW